MKTRYLIKNLILLTIIFFLFYCISALGQVPESFNYQAILRDASGNVRENETVSIDILLHEGSPDGSAVFSETHAATTNAFGLINLEIGSVNPAGFAAIDWSIGTYFITLVVDGTEMGTSQLLSVPYALYAKTAENVTGGISETDPVFTSSQAANITVGDITKLSDLSGVNTGDQDLSSLATKTALGDSTAQVRSEIPDVSGFVSTETDPVYSASQAANISATDITNLGNLSGTNTGDQNLSGLATTTALITGLSAKVDKETGKGLSTNDYTTAEKTKLAGVATGAEVNVNANWNATSGDAQILNKPTIPAAADGSETKVTAGTNVTVTGAGTTASPYVVNTTTYSVGDFAQGGIVFLVDETGQHGLVCAKEDQSTGVRWYAGTYGNTQAKGDGIYAGEANTSIIIAAQVAIGDDGSTYAARICNELQITESGIIYGDWYLPSKYELNMMYANKATIDATATANGGSAFATYYYWSSTEHGNNFAWDQDFGSGGKGIYSKNGMDRVRAVRAF